MSLRRPFASHNLRSLFLVIHPRFLLNRPTPNLVRDSPLLRQNYSFHANQGMHFISRESDLQNEHLKKIGQKEEDDIDTDRQSIGSGAIPSPKKPKYPYWGRWILGIMLSIVLPFWNNNWEKLLKIEDEVEKVVEVVENTAEVVETVATVTENLSTAAADKLPDNGKLKDAALFVKHVSEEAVKNAQLTEDFIHKVDDLKEEVETLVKPITEKE